MADRTVGWRTGTLGASVVLNLFLIALVVGHALRWGAGEVNSQTVLTRAIARIEARLPPQDAAAFRAVMTRDEPRLLEDQKQLVEARQELKRRISAEPFDKARTREALTASRTIGDRYFDDFSDSFVDALSKVSAEGRRKLVGRRAFEGEKASAARP
jgi:uncharacterized membrane protein